VSAKIGPARSGVDCQRQILRIQRVCAPDPDEVILVKHVLIVGSPYGSSTDLIDIGVPFDYQNISRAESIGVITRQSSRRLDL
jgi:hypothetical protein